MNILQKLKTSDRGSILIYSIVIIFIFSLVMLSALSYAQVQLKTVRGTINKELAFEIAEAGVNYYQWRLAHYPTDYQDGTGVAGPYVHDYIDDETSQVTGRFSLVITPPLPGSTVVTIKSTGYSLDNTNIKRTITTRFGIASLAKYAFLTNADTWIGNTESVSGEFHSNGGVRFDGTGNAPIYSSKSTYTCPSYSGSGCPATKPGIWGSAPVATQNFWQFPVSNVDFTTMTADLNTIRNSAQTSGIYLAPSSAQGYSLVFQSNGTVNIYRVNSLASGQPSAWNVSGAAVNTSTNYNARTQLDGDTGTAGTQSFSIPSNGLIFVEDKSVWVEGMLNGRVIVAASRFTTNIANQSSIYIPNNICYTQCGGSRDSTSSLGLIAEKDIVVPYTSPSDLEIDAALIAQKGSIQHYTYAQYCNSSPRAVKNSITIFGAIISYGIWTWSWTDCAGTGIISGYTNTLSIYDGNLLYAPPPSFPLTSSGYQQISWTSD